MPFRVTCARGMTRLRDRVTIETYGSGHMMYIDEPSLAKMKEDMAAFVDRALGR